MVNRETLNKEERISLKKDIDLLFSKGKSVVVYPLRVIFLKSEEGKAISRMLVSVPKRLLKKSVDRNRVKRLIKESFRLNKREMDDFLASRNYGLFIAFVYRNKTLVEFSEMEFSVRKSLSAIKNSLNDQDIKENRD